jgi:SAM-dependent methyltransferase
MIARSGSATSDLDTQTRGQRAMADLISREKAFWDSHARRDPLWAILSDPAKKGRRWDLQSFFKTGWREVSLLMYQLRALKIDVSGQAALDFGSGVGRVTQPLGKYFDRVVGVDVSPEMTRLANELNRYPARVQYVCNPREDLDVFATSAFTFMYSNVVLQHIEPAAALKYLAELFRVVAPGGVLVFQLPSHPRPADEQEQLAAPMPAEAYRASIRVHCDVPQDLAAGAEIVLAASVTNTSVHHWRQRETGPIRYGNHWLTGSGHAMLIQDDGRVALPEHVAPGETCHVALKLTAPQDPGEYQIECDVVHEGISWFADKGSETWRFKTYVSGSPNVRPPDGLVDPAFAGHALALPDDSSIEEPGPLPMHGIHRHIVETLIRQNGGTLAHLEIDERCGKEWVGYRYFVKKL